MNDKPTKSQLYDFLEASLSTTGCMVSKRVFIDESPTSIRHSCVVTGVVLLNVQYFTAPDGFRMRYYYCSACGALYIARLVT